MTPYFTHDVLGQRFGLGSGRRFFCGYRALKKCVGFLCIRLNGRSLLQSYSPCAIRPLQDYPCKVF